MKHYWEMGTRQQKTPLVKKVRKFVIVGTPDSGKFELVNRFFGFPFDLKRNKNASGTYTHHYCYHGYRLTILVAILSNHAHIEAKKFHIRTADVIMFTYASDYAERDARDVRELYKLVREVREDKMPLVVIRTKSDLRASLEHEAAVSDIVGAKHVATSAKYNINVHETFEYCLRNVLKRIHMYSMSQIQEVLQNCKKQSKSVDNEEAQLISAGEASCWNRVFSSCHTGLPKLCLVRKQHCVRF